MTNVKRLPDISNLDRKINYARAQLAAEQDNLRYFDEGHAVGAFSDYAFQMLAYPIRKRIARLSREIQATEARLAEQRKTQQNRRGSTQRGGR